VIAIAVVSQLARHAVAGRWQLGGEQIALREILEERDVGEPDDIRLDPADLHLRLDPGHDRPDPARNTLTRTPASRVKSCVFAFTSSPDADV
jgi:hypothetical protein